MNAPEVVRQMVEKRLCGEERELVLDVLFAEPAKRIYISPSKIREGNPLSESEKESIRSWAGSGLLHSEIAEKVGVSRQAVTGVLTGARRK